MCVAPVEPVKMKVCVYIKKSTDRGRGKCLSLIKHCLGEGRGEKEFDDGKSRVASVDACGLVGASNTANPAAMRDNLLRHHHGGRSKELAKHIVLSGADESDPEKRRAAFRILRRLAFLFLKTYAPGCASLAFVHTDKKHPHIHLIVCNSDSERSLHWTPTMLREMQSMIWITKDLAKLVQPGRKQHRKAVHDAYPLARLTLAAELAAMPLEELEKIPWYQRGNTRVFLYKQRKIRERTINREREKNEIKSSSGERCDAHRIPPGHNAPEPNTRGAANSSSVERRIACPATGRNGSDVADTLSADIKALQEIGSGRRRYARIQMPSIKLG